MSNETAEQYTLTAAEIENLQTAFAMLNPLEFAKHLHTLDLPDSVKGDWLRLKVRQRPTEREAVMERAIEAAMERFWTGLAQKQAKV